MSKNNNVIDANAIPPKRETSDINISTDKIIDAYKYLNSIDIDNINIKMIDFPFTVVTKLSLSDFVSAFEKVEKELKVYSKDNSIVATKSRLKKILNILEPTVIIKPDNYEFGLPTKNINSNFISNSEIEIYLSKKYDNMETINGNTFHAWNMHGSRIEEIYVPLNNDGKNNLCIYIPGNNGSNNCNRKFVELYHGDNPPNYITIVVPTHYGNVNLDTNGQIKETPYITQCNNSLSNAYDFLQDNNISPKNIKVVCFSGGGETGFIVAKDYLKNNPDVNDLTLYAADVAFNTQDAKTKGQDIPSFINNKLYAGMPKADNEANNYEFFSTDDDGKFKSTVKLNVVLRDKPVTPDRKQSIVENNKNLFRDFSNVSISFSDGIYVHEEVNDFIIESVLKY